MSTSRILGSFAAAVLAGTALAAPHSNSNRRVYTLSNESSGNRLLVYDRDNDGTLHQAGSVMSGGMGSGGGLGNQGALAMSGDGRFIVGVNAGSNSITLFEVKGNGIERAQVLPSGGQRPISVAIDGHDVYVLNAGGAVGGADDVAGFRMHGRRLSPIPGSMAPLSAANTGPAQVAFAGDGGVLVVTEKATNRIDTFRVDEDGTLSGPQVFPSAGATPFGFDVTGDGELIVSEAQGGAPNLSSVSAYDVDDNGMLTTITPSLSTRQLAACWVAVSRGGRYAYTGNAASRSVTGVAIDDDGALSLVDASGLSGATAPGAAADLGFSRDGKFLYVLTHGTNGISAFRQDRDGNLEPLGEFGQLPASATGLIAR